MTNLAREQISAAGPRLCFVHGFTQTRESWRPVAERFVGDHAVRLLDAPHHGGSSDLDVDLPGAADLIARAAGGGTCVGYSMGGRMSLLAALTHPDQIGALVLVSATPGIDVGADRQARRDADDRLADEIERVGTATFLESWLAQPMFARLRPDARDIAARLANPPGALARSLRRCGTGTQEPLWSRLGSLTMPVLLVSGEADGKFTDITCRMAAALPQARLEIIEGAGHAPHLEQPDAFTTVLREWLNDNGR